MALSETVLDAMISAKLAIAPIPWTALFAALHNGDPGTDGANETAAAGYARRDSTGLWSVTAGVVQNTAIIGQFDATGNDTITHWGVWTLASGGIFLFGGPLTASAPIGPSNGINFAANDLTYTYTTT